MTDEQHHTGGRFFEQHMSDDAADYKILGFARDNKFALAVGYKLIEPLRLSFQRGVDQEWYRLIDVDNFEGHGTFRIFSLTEKGKARLAELQEKLGPIPPGGSSLMSRH